MASNGRLYDQLDYEIIRLLNQDGRISASEIARILKANPRTIRKRIDALVASGAIIPTAIVNPTVFGYTTAVDIFLEVEHEFEKEVISRLLGMQEVSYLAYGQGSRDISIEARFKNNGEMYDFVRNTLEAMPGVKVTRLVLVPRILRNINEWLPKKEDFLGND
ncbi:MAG: hypothetical protein Kow00124_29590 [Anaerolineae bacterium]